MSKLVLDTALAEYERQFNFNGEIRIVGESAAWLLHFLSESSRKSVLSETGDTNAKPREVMLMLARALSTIRYEVTGALANYLSPDGGTKRSLIRIEGCARDALESLKNAAPQSQAIRRPEGRAEGGAAVDEEQSDALVSSPKSPSSAVAAPDNALVAQSLERSLIKRGAEGSRSSECTQSFSDDKREKCCGEWDSIAGRCADCPHDKQKTPRTDTAERDYADEAVQAYLYPQGNGVSADFARQLERELAIAQDDLQAQCKAWWKAASPYATPKALREALSARGEPAAWRYRYGKTGMWKYVDRRDEVNPGEHYEVEPLYVSHPSPKEKS